MLNHSAFHNKFWLAVLLLSREQTAVSEIPYTKTSMVSLEPLRDKPEDTHTKASMLSLMRYRRVKTRPATHYLHFRSRRSSAGEIQSIFSASVFFTVITTAARFSRSASEIIFTGRAITAVKQLYL